jgi:hypothetical protein
MFFNRLITLSFLHHGLLTGLVLLRPSFLRQAR